MIFIAYFLHHVMPPAFSTPSLCDMHNILFCATCMKGQLQKMPGPIVQTLSRVYMRVTCFDIMISVLYLQQKLVCEGVLSEVCISILVQLVFTSKNIFHLATIQIHFIHTTFRAICKKLISQFFSAKWIKLQLNKWLNVSILMHPIPPSH